MKNVGDDYPVVAQPDGNIKLKIEKMETEKLYYCVQDNAVFLFFKDEAGLLNCYEVNDPDTVAEISKNPSDLEVILKRRSSSIQKEGSPS
jgi:hypothetical protein